MKQTGKSASKINPKGIPNTARPVARRQRAVGLYPDKNLVKFLAKCRKKSGNNKRRRFL